jgi:hypothetical protein
MVRGPIAGSSFSQPSKQLMEDVKQSSSMLSGRRPSVSVAKAAISAGSGLDAIATIYAGEFSVCRREVVAYHCAAGGLSCRLFSNTAKVGE